MEHNFNDINFYFFIWSFWNNSLNYFSFFYEFAEFYPTGHSTNLLKIADFPFILINKGNCFLEHHNNNCSSIKYLNNKKITLFKGMHLILVCLTSWNSDLTVKSFQKMCRKLYVNQRERRSCNEFSEPSIYDKVIWTLMSPFYVIDDAKFSFISSGVLISLFVSQFNTKERCLFKTFWSLVCRYNKLLKGNGIKTH